MKGIELPNQKRISTFEWEENNKYLGILKADNIKKCRLERKNKRVPQTNKKASRKQAFQQEPQ